MLDRALCFPIPPCASSMSASQSLTVMVHVVPQLAYAIRFWSCHFGSWRVCPVTDLLTDFLLLAPPIFSPHASMFFTSNLSFSHLPLSLPPCRW